MREVRYEITETDCWEIRSHKADRDGYVYLHHEGKHIAAHRLYFSLHNGEILPGNVVRHTCDNPICINPSHLQQGSHKDNAHDRVVRGRGATGTRNGSSKLTEDQVLLIKSASGKIRTLAKNFGVDPKTIRNIKQGKKWVYVTDPKISLETRLPMRPQEVTVE